MKLPRRQFLRLAWQAALPRFLPFYESPARKPIRPDR
jgi:hypothetical protein